MRDGVTFALLLLAAACAACLPLLVILTAVAGALSRRQGQKKTAPGGSNTKSGRAENET